MDITGNIIAALPAVSGTSQRSGNTWKKQDFVLEIPGAWPRHLCFTVFGEDHLKQMDIKQGEQNVTVFFEIDAHPYQDKWYNEIRAYNIIRHNAQQQQPAGSVGNGSAVAQSSAQPAAPAQPQGDDKPADDLPF